MKAHVSTMLTEKRLEYCTAGVSLQGSDATKWRVQDDKHAIRGAFRLDILHASDRQRVMASRSAPAVFTL